MSTMLHTWGLFPPSTTSGYAPCCDGIGPLNMTNQEIRTKFLLVNCMGRYCGKIFCSEGRT